MSKPIFNIGRGNRVVPQYCSNVRGGNYENRVPVLNHFAIGLLIDKTRRKHDAKLSVSNSRNQSRHLLYTNTAVGRIALGLKCAVNLQRVVRLAAWADGVIAKGIAPAISPWPRQREIDEIVVHFADQIGRARFESIRIVLIVSTNGLETPSPLVVALQLLILRWNSDNSRSAQSHSAVSSLLDELLPSPKSKRKAVVMIIQKGLKPLSGNGQTSSVEDGKIRFVVGL